MSCKGIPARTVLSTLTRLNCCAELFIGAIDTMVAEGFPRSSLLRLVGACDLLEAIIQDVYNEVGEECGGREWKQG